MTFLIIIAWILCGVLTYAISFADLQSRFQVLSKVDYRQDMSMSVFIGLLGPIGLLIILFISGFAEHGLKFK